MQVLLVVAWPVLPLWVAAHRVRQLVELACDEAALRGANAAERKRYGHALIDASEPSAFGSLFVHADGLRFGSMLRARVEAIARARHASRATQLALVTGAVLALVACASVSPRSNATSPSDAPPRAEATAPSVATNAPPSWSAEGRNNLGQIAMDTAAAYERSVKAGKPAMCPSGAPIPATLQAPGAKYQPSEQDWNDNAGWQCLQFAIASPMYFQLRVETRSDGFVATAHAQGTRDGRLFDVKMVLRGTVSASGADVEVAPNLEETWTPLQ
jgi:hypothetical protein